MSRLHVIALLIALAGMLTSLPAHAATAEANAGNAAARHYDVEFYDRWADLPTDTLMARGLHYLRSDNPRQQQREACRRFSDQQHYGKLTIEAVAASVGIKSRTSFIANFKKHTGLTPSEYVREARNRS